MLPACAEACKELLVVTPSKLHVMVPEVMSWIGQKLHRRGRLPIAGGMLEEYLSRKRARSPRCDIDY